MSVCLCMMVRNEASLIREALRSVKPYITTYSIMDTGSTDDTKAIILDELAGISGTIHDRPWTGWDKSRTEAMTLAKQSGADYLFLLDADETVSGEMTLSADAHWVTIVYGPMVYQRPNILSTKYDWKYIGVTHECLVCDTKGAQPKEVVLPITLKTNDARTNKNKDRIQDDIDLLEAALKTNPDNARYVFYLAQSYRDISDNYKSMELYEARAGMGGWHEEVWYSLYQRALLMIRLNYPEIDITEAFVKAHEFHSMRGEALGSLSQYLRSRGKNSTAFMIASAAKNIPASSDKLFVDNSFAQWRNLDEYAVAAFYAGKFETAYKANLELLGDPNRLPESEKPRVLNNCKLARARMDA